MQIGESDATEIRGDKVDMKRPLDVKALRIPVSWVGNARSTTMLSFCELERQASAIPGSPSCSLACGEKAVLGPRVSDAGKRSRVVVVVCNLYRGDRLLAFFALESLTMYSGAEFEESSPCVRLWDADLASPVGSLAVMFSVTTVLKAEIVFFLLRGTRFMGGIFSSINWVGKGML